MNYDSVKFEPATNGKNKFIAIFTNRNLPNGHKDREKRILFGGPPHMFDYTSHRAEIRDEKKRLYNARFRGIIDLSDPFKKSTLSTMILWNKPTITESIADYKKKFGFT
jgi:hypothetical protein